MRRFYIYITILSALVLNGITYSQTEKQLELTKIEFEGNTAFAADELKAIISQKESPPWFSKFLNSITSFGSPASYFDSLLIAGDISNLEKYYWSNGFFEANATAIYSLDTLGEEASIKFFIDEGPPYKYGVINQPGLLHKVHSAILYEINKENIYDSTMTYSESAMKNLIDYTKAYLKDNGYMLASSSTPVVNIDTSSKYVEVLVKYNAGNRYKVSDLRVNLSGIGKEYIEPKLVRELVGIQKDEYYNFYKLQQAQIRLYRTGLFTGALVSGDLSDTTGSFVPINISVDVGPPHELSPDVFVNDEDNSFNLGVGLSFIKKNFLGDARKVGVSVSAAAQDIVGFISHFSISDTTLFGYADARVTVEQPVLFGNFVDTRLESYITLQKRRNEYNATIYGAQLKFVYELPRYVFLTYLSTYFNWENTRYLLRKEYFIQTYKNWLLRNGADPNSVESLLTGLYLIDPNSLISRTSTAIIGLEFGTNKTNDIIFPTRGTNVIVTLEEGNFLPFSISKLWGYNIESPLYYKILFSLIHYPPVYNSKLSSLALKFKIGHIHAYRGSKHDISLNQRFAAGGANSLRGWRTRELVPVGFEFLIPENISLDELESLFLRDALPGGFFLLEGSFETRNRIIGPLGTALFIDYGNVWNSYKDFTWKEMAVTAGFGLRYYSDFAPFRIDFGFKAYDPWDTRPFMRRLDDPGGIWNTLEFHIGIGEAF